MIKVVAENINIMSKYTGNAMREKDPKPIQEWAVKLTDRGADVLDLNLGPARKGGPEMMQWLVKTVQEVTDLPLFLDTTNSEAVEAGLQVYVPKNGPAVINSIMATPERMALQLPLVSKYGCDMVGLMWGPEGMPRDENERGMLTAEILAKAAEYDIENERIWFDPIIAPLNIQQNQLIATLDYMHMLQDMAPGCKSTCGLSNCSNGVPDELRPIINRAYVIMLQRNGMVSAIVDAFDQELADVVNGKMPEAVKIVYDIMDGKSVDIPSMSKTLQNYAKTARVIMGQVLFSDSWLEI